LSQHNILYNNEFGFRKNHPTELALIKLLDDITSAIDSKHIVCSIAIDLKKAFDTVDLDKLLHKLDIYGFRGMANQYLRSYLFSRQQYVQISGHNSTPNPISHGVPQGSILGPVFFLIYINDLPKALPNNSPILFADDTTLTFVAKSFPALNNIVNSDLSHLSSWLTANKLSLNLSKTNYILFHPPTHIPSSFSITINSLPISRALEICILGVTIDEDISFKSHTAQLKKKLSSSLFIFNKIRYKLPMTIAWSLYHSLFKSHLIYCILIWGHSHTSYLQPINTLHNKFLKTLLFLPMRTPTNQVYSQASVLSLPQLYQLFSALFVYKFINHPHLIPNSLNSIFTPLTSTHSHHTRASNSLNLFYQSCSSVTRQNHIAIQGPLIWSTVPNEIKSSQYINAFKHLLCTHLKKSSPL